MLDMETMALTQRPSRRGTVLGDLTVVIGALLAAVATWTLWTQVGSVELTVQSGDDVQTIGIGPVVAVAAIMPVAGVLLFRALEAWLSHGMRSWTAVACTVTLISMLGPLGATTATAGVALASLHLLVGAVVIFGVRRVHHAR
jgi:predicted ribosomally synthesized peptide with SipW-like signal peptide